MRRPLPTLTPYQTAIHRLRVLAFAVALGFAWFQPWPSPEWDRGYSWDAEVARWEVFCAAPPERFAAEVHDAVAAGDVWDQRRAVLQRCQGRTGELQTAEAEAEDASG